jgi:hypothetical protein
VDVHEKFPRNVNAEKLNDWDQENNLQKKTRNAQNLLHWKPFRNHNVLKLTRSEVEVRQAGHRKLIDCPFDVPYGEKYGRISRIRVPLVTGTFTGSEKCAS